MALTLAGATAYSTRQAAIASREARRATAIKDFLLEVFQQASAKASLHSEPQNLRVIQMIDEGRDRLVTSLAGQPEVQMEVIAVLGDIYELLDATDQAAALFQQGLAIADGAFGPGGPHSAEMMGATANVAAFAGDFPAAEAHVRSAEAAFAALGDHESLAYARTLKVKGSLARRRGPEGLRQAVAVLREAAALFARRFPRDSNHSATYMYLAQTHIGTRRTARGPLGGSRQRGRGRPASAGGSSEPSQRLLAARIRARSRRRIGAGGAGLRPGLGRLPRLGRSRALPLSAEREPREAWRCRPWDGARRHWRRSRRRQRRSPGCGRTRTPR